MARSENGKRMSAIEDVDDVVVGAGYVPAGI